MFDKEAEEYTLKKLVGLEDFDSYQSAYDRYENGVQDAFKDGAEFGFNNANEWHYPLTLDKDGQPISDNPVAESYPIEILMYDFDTGSKEVIKYDTSWAYYRKDGSSIRRNHIAWQYITIPNKEGV